VEPVELHRILRNCANGDCPIVVDVREPWEYRQGHVPGAVSAPYAENLEPDGRFKPKGQLRRRYLEVLGGVPAERAGCYCGSGVTAAHDVLAIMHAGLGEAKLYAGSWSEWITDHTLPVTTGG